MGKQEYPQAHFVFPPSDYEMEFKKAIASNECPRFLFKYMGVKGVLRFLENAQLLYSNPFLFNDPFDCKANILTNNCSENDWYCLFSHIQMNSDALRFFVERAMVNPENANDVVRSSIEETKSQYGILCLTNKNDSILMWSHYADKHQGVCIQFDISSDCYSFYKPAKVKYSNKYLTINYVKNREQLGWSFLRKSKEWEYEDEYRIIKPSGFGLSAVKKECVVSIIFGCKISQEDEEMISQKVKENNFVNVKYKRAVQDIESYKLNIIDIQ